jgi:hypothetical protein
MSLRDQHFLCGAPARRHDGLLLDFEHRRQATESDLIVARTRNVAKGQKRELLAQCSVCRLFAYAAAATGQFAETPMASKAASIVA